MHTVFDNVQPYRPYFRNPQAVSVFLLWSYICTRHRSLFERCVRTLLKGFALVLLSESGAVYDNHLQLSDSCPRCFTTTVPIEWRYCKVHIPTRRSTIRFRISLTGAATPAAYCLTTPTARQFPVPAAPWKRTLALTRLQLGRSYRGAVSAAQCGSWLLAAVVAYHSTPRPPIDPFIHYELPRTAIPKTFQETHTPRRHHYAREPRCEPAASASSKPRHARLRLHLPSICAILPDLPYNLSSPQRCGDFPPAIALVQ
jgi:hypothetical protein